MISVSGIILVADSYFFYLRKPNELNIPDIASQKYKSIRSGWKIILNIKC